MGVARLAALLETQRPNLPLWAPVLFAAGIGGYFALPVEPAGTVLLALAAALLTAVPLLLPAGWLARLLLFLVIWSGLGFEDAALRSRYVAAPVLPYEMTANLSGRIIDLDRSSSDRPRVLLDQVVIYGLDPDRTPARVRISLDPSTPPDVLRPGVRLLGQARLAPPAAPSEPGGFDYRRLAWFARIGAVGYAATPMLETEGSDRSGLRQLAFRIRMASSAHIQAEVPGQNGAFAAAILTGDRSGIDRSVETALKASSLYHIVSISGEHMTLMAAAVFAMIRYGLALVPWLALHWPLKKIAACAALAAGAAYLVISGCDVATQRAYVMTATVLVAVLLDRPAITMRSVGLATLIVLAIAPDSLMEAGVQMSFAATIAIIAAFEGLRSQAWWRWVQTDRRWRHARLLLVPAMTSLAAGTATAPFSAFHFNTTTQYGVLANLLAEPAMAVVAMPAAVASVVAAPLRLDWLPLQLVGWAMGYIIAVADLVAGFGGAMIGVRAGPPVSLVLIAVGGIFLVLWIGRGRWLGLAPIALALLLWAGDRRPDIMIADDGRLFGIRTSAGRILSSARGDSYAAENWLRNDGDLSSPAEAYARGGLVRKKNRIEATVPGLGAVLYVGASSAAGAAADCASAAILIAPNWHEAPRGPCLFVGRERLRRDGALGISLNGEGLVVEGARALNRTRPWTRDPDSGVGRDPDRLARQ